VSDNGRPTSASAFAALRQIMPERAPAERCDLCAIPIEPEHQHLVDPENRQIVCSCRACALLFENQGARKYKLVPIRVQLLKSFQMTDEQWDNLLIPVGMAFFFNSIPSERVVALYPSPAGATESLLPLESWQDLEKDNAELAAMEPDVEALLVNRIGQARDYFIAPIDECYKLVGLLRAGWKGLSGGTDVWKAINEFFADLKARAVVIDHDA
jgi:hypothetical protein